MHLNKEIKNEKQVILHEMWFCEKVQRKEIIRAHMINGKEISCEIKVKICMVCGEELSGVNTIDEELEIFREKYKKVYKNS